MAKGPSSKDYAPSEAENVNAQIGQSEYSKFKEKYAPILKLRAAESQTDAVKTNLRGRAQADTMRALSKPSLAVAESTTAAGDMAEATTGQLSKANTTAREYNNKVGLSVLARGRQQAAAAQEGLSTVARLSASEALTRAQGKQEVAQAKINAAVKIGSSFVAGGMENLSQTGDWFTPGIQNPGTDGGKPTYRKPQGLGEYFGAFTNRNS